MSWSAIVVWLPAFRSRAAVGNKAAPGELKSLEDRVIADLGLLWCDVAYPEHGTPSIAE